MDHRSFTNDSRALQELSCVIRLFIPRWAVTPENCSHIHCMPCMLQLLARRHYSCPYCRQPSRGLRSTSEEIEAMYYAMLYPCVHCSNGFHADDIDAHEQMCLRRRVGCMHPGCEWRGGLEDQVWHLLTCRPPGTTPV